MNLLEAIKTLRDTPETQSEMWMRPVSYKGSRQAFCVHYGYICHVPTPRGAFPGMTSNIDFILEDWEIVNPDVVNNEMRNETWK